MTTPTLVTGGPEAPAEFKLTPAEMRVIRAFRNLCDSHKELLLDTAELCAVDPSLKRGPALRLVDGGRQP